jgi:hypothetical protein
MSHYLSGLSLGLDPISFNEVEESWAAEVERRQSEIENGADSLMLGPENLTS